MCAHQSRSIQPSDEEIERLRAKHGSGWTMSELLKLEVAENCLLRDRIERLEEAVSNESRARLVLQWVLDLWGKRPRSDPALVLGRIEESALTEKSLGEERVRGVYNKAPPAGEINNVKTMTAALIDYADAISRSNAEPEVRRLCAMAMTSYEEAAMWLVKALTREGTVVEPVVTPWPPGND